MENLVPFAPPELGPSVHVAPTILTQDVQFLRSLLNKRQNWPEDKLKLELLKFCLAQEDGNYSSFSASDSSITDASLKVLCSAYRNTLQVCDLRGCRKITRAGLVTLANLVNLRELNLSRSGLGVEDLQSLRGLKHLRTLKLVGLSIGDAIVETLATLDGLEELDLSKTKVTQVGLSNLSASTVGKSLIKLNIAGTPASIVAKMASFTEFGSLRQLQLGASDQDVLDRIKTQFLAQSDVLSVSVSNGTVEIKRVYSTEDPSSDRRMAPPELVSLLERVHSTSECPPAPHISVSAPSYFGTQSKTAVRQSMIHIAFTPRRSPRLAKKMQSSSTAQSISSPSRKQIRRTLTDDHEDRMDIASPLRVADLNLSFNSATDSPSKKSNLKKRSLLEAFGEDASEEPMSKRARRVSFAGFEPSALTPTQDENAMDVDSSLAQAHANGIRMPFGSSKIVVEPPLQKQPGLFGTLQGFFF
eukprot:TRINITY_DN10743_c0_g1_i1.p1 TRINITY_DN10743_c0_g1~~TRINITY_DN10743_c0_g1_i1.p1  ORF type:complete len:472 (-),score=90.08 TRINITY_DN10743_c0_g1_i1:36-1451(-)